MEQQTKIQRTVARQREYYLLGETHSKAWRLTQLERLEKGLKNWEERLFTALNQDLGKSRAEAYATELGMVYGEIALAKKKLADWMRPKKVSSPMHQFPSYSRIVMEPRGCVLIMSPWNYPLQLTINPLIAALAAGNVAIVKPSRYSAHTSAAIANMLKEAFPEEIVAVFEGGSEVNQALLQERFDLIFFTGSPRVGKVVLRAAAETLTPAILELGGKSPCIVDETADIDRAARRIIWGKCLNAGQTCVAPDYVLVHQSVEKTLIREMERAITAQFGSHPLENPEYPHIINQHHYERLVGLMQSGEVLFGGETDASQLRIAPTLMKAAIDAAVMQEEIFGPLLPIFAYDSLDEVIRQLAKQEKPLALYLFTTSREAEARVTERISFGGGCINDTVVHLTNPELPFGGVGNSGMGSYHGKTGFDTFSHAKGILKKSNRVDVTLRYPPYGEEAEQKFRKWMK